MALYRDEISRITLPQVRAQFTPKDFAQREHVTLTRGALTAVVKIVREIVPGGLKKPRVFLRCGSCGARANVLAFGYDRIGCRRCMDWRTREPQTAKRMAPHAAPVDVTHRS
jgi:hypothetical protein